MFVLTYSATGSMGASYNTSFTVSLPTIKGVGSHGFSIQVKKTSASRSMLDRTSAVFSEDSL
jgi:hypothetical protein